MRKKVLKEAEGLPGEIAYKKCDVMKREDITALVQFTLERYGRVDVMVNNAIIDNPRGLLDKIPLEDWEDGIFCHMTAPFLFCKEVVRGDEYLLFDSWYLLHFLAPDC